MAKNTQVMPNPSDIAYVDRGVFDFIMSVLRYKNVNYSSPHHDLIYNQVVKDVRERICSSIQPK